MVHQAHKRMADETVITRQDLFLSILGFGFGGNNSFLVCKLAMAI
jgi:hypothetical protein